MAQCSAATAKGTRCVFPVKPPSRSLCGKHQNALARGSVVMWFQERMEYGPRALGCRSVLARPDRPELRERLEQLVARPVGRGRRG